ncbi:MAG: hypothetical protein JO067_05685 [Cupriavidus sp.]|nr:hypothetical protein [Cupriavidus sp.]
MSAVVPEIDRRRVWSVTERCIRILWSVLLAITLIGGVIDMLSVSGQIDSGLPPDLPLWRLHGFSDARAFYDSNGTGIVNACFALVGLWLPRRSRWLRWAWSIPFVASTAINSYLYL